MTFTNIFLKSCPYEKPGSCPYCKNIYLFYTFTYRLTLFWDLGGGDQGRGDGSRCVPPSLWFSCCLPDFAVTFPEEDLKIFFPHKVKEFILFKWTTPMPPQMTLSDKRCLFLELNKHNYFAPTLKKKKSILFLQIETGLRGSLERRVLTQVCATWRVSRCCLE